MLLAVCHALPSSLFFTRRQTCAGPIGGHSKTGVRLEFIRLSCVVFLHRRACSFFFCVWFTTTPKRSNAREGARAPRDVAPASLAPTSPRRPPPALRLAAGPCPARSGQSRLVGSDGHRCCVRETPCAMAFSRSNDLISKQGQNLNPSPSPSLPRPTDGSWGRGSPSSRPSLASRLRLLRERCTEVSRAYSMHRSRCDQPAGAV